MSQARDRIDFLRRLRSIRRFSTEPVPQLALDDVLEVARWTGSSGNRQPWELVVVRERATLRALAEVGPAPGLRPLADAPLAIVPVLTRQFAEIDGGRLLERIMLAAAAHGLGSGLAGFGDAAAAVKELLGVPAEHTVRVAVAIGFPADAGARLVSVERRVDRRLPLDRLPLGRKPLAEILHLERYRRPPTAPEAAGE